MNERAQFRDVLDWMPHPMRAMVFVTILALTLAGELVVCSDAQAQSRIAVVSHTDASDTLASSARAVLASRGLSMVPESEVRAARSFTVTGVLDDSSLQQLRVALSIDTLLSVQALSTPSGIAVRIRLVSREGIRQQFFEAPPELAQQELGGALSTLFQSTEAPVGSQTVSTQQPSRSQPVPNQTSATSPRTVAQGIASAPSTIVVRNSSSVPVCTVNFGPTSDSNWGVNRLQHQSRVSPGESANFETPAGQYDIRVLGCDGTTLSEVRNVSLSSVAPHIVTIGAAERRSFHLSGMAGINLAALKLGSRFLLSVGLNISTTAALPLMNDYGIGLAANLNISDFNSGFSNTSTGSVLAGVSWGSSVFGIGAAFLPEPFFAAGGQTNIRITGLFSLSFRVLTAIGLVAGSLMTWNEVSLGLGASY